MGMVSIPDSVLLKIAEQVGDDWCLFIDTRVLLLLGGLMKPDRIALLERLIADRVIHHHEDMELDAPAKNGLQNCSAGKDYYGRDRNQTTSFERG